jgi:hypothetical protein
MENQTGMVRVLSLEETSDLAKRVLLMAEMANRKISDEALEFWIAELSPRYDEHMRQALDWGAKQKFMPSVTEIQEKATDAMLRSHERLKQAQRDAEHASCAAMTEEQRQASDKAMREALLAVLKS